MNGASGHSAIAVRPVHFLLAATLLAALAAVLFFNALREKHVESGVYRVVTDRGTGTGFKIAEPGIVVTNYHVVRQARELVVMFAGSGGPEMMPMRVIWQDTERDLAILESRKDLPGTVLVLADIGVDDLQKKDYVEAIGYPGAADDLARASANNLLRQSVWVDATVSTGTVQRQVPSLSRYTIQHSANINPGNSGGPLLDSCQRVVGVNTLTAATTIDAREMVDALTKTGAITFTTPDSLKSSVHVREVLDALAKENIAGVTSAGRCRSGVEPRELWPLGLASVLSFACLAASGVLLLRGPGGRHPARPQAAAAGAAPQDEAAGTELVRAPAGERIELVRVDDGAVFPGPILAALEGERSIVIGRGDDGVDIVIDDTAISRRHAAIRRHPDGSLILSDLASTNGTQVDGVAVRDGEAHPVRDGSRILFGDSAFALRLSAPAEAAAPGHGGTWVISGFDGRGRVIRSEIVFGGAPGGRNRPVRVGRAADNDIIIDEPSVSRYHARLSLDARANLLRVEDAGSSNGTYVNGGRVGNGPVPVGPDQKIRFGEIVVSVSRIA